MTIVLNMTAGTAIQGAEPLASKSAIFEASPTTKK
jgi:hypothetical protein